ncbi:MAG: YcaO-like family protein [Granulosicoccus sp.]
MDVQSKTKCFLDGTHRIRTPEDTLERMIPHMRAMGITRIADVTGLDEIGIPVVMVCRPNSRSVSVSQGKGSTLDAAKASGLMESIESFHAESITLPLRIASTHDMNSSSYPTIVEQLPVVRHSPFHKHHPISWIESIDLVSGKPYWLPYELVHTNYTYPRPTGSGCFSASSNGLASGNSIVEATVHAICEVIERDALTLWTQMGASAQDRTSIDLDTVDNIACRTTLDKLVAAKQDTYVWNITSDTGVPSYFAVIRDQYSQSSHIGVGAGTHLSHEVALLRALHEAVQVRTTYIVGARDDIYSEEYTPEGKLAKQKAFGRYINDCSFTTAFPASSGLASDSMESDLQTLLTCLKQVGIFKVLQVDLSKPEYKVPVVRVVIPGLEAPHDEDGYLPGDRAERFRQAAGE